MFYEEEELQLAIEIKGLLEDLPQGSPLNYGKGTEVRLLHDGEPTGIVVKRDGTGEYGVSIG